MSILLPTLLTLGILLIFFGLASSFRETKRMDAVAQQYGRAFSLEEAELAQPFSVRVVRPALRALAQLLNHFTPQQMMETTRVKLDLAGNPLDLPPTEFLGLRGLATALGALLFIVLSASLHASGPLFALLIVAGAGLGFYAPLLWLNLKIRQRQAEIRYALPDALDLLTVSVEAGLGLDAAIAQVVDKWDNQLSRAFGRASREIRLGRPRHLVLRDMADRAAVQELTNFVASLIQAERYGTGIAKVLRIQSEQMRVLRRQRAQEEVNKMPIKLLFPLIFFLFPAIFIVLLGPAVLRLMGGFLP
ncbi:MAG: type II secretion system F family protein [Chloroflexi bacterium]|nr:type II secretion system F family protein [Chloroflexota bacterium]